MCPGFVLKCLLKAEMVLTVLATSCTVESISGLMKFFAFLLLVAAIIGIELLFDKIEQSGNAKKN